MTAECAHDSPNRCFALLALARGFARAGRALRLSMKRAVELATSPEGNANMQIAGEAVKQAQARSAQARAALLPALDAAVSEINQTRNLAALGIRFTVADPGLQFSHVCRAVQCFRCAPLGHAERFRFQLHPAATRHRSWA